MWSEIIQERSKNASYESSQELRAVATLGGVFHAVCLNCALLGVICCVVNTVLW
ncbi:hypothetical protein [Bartonella sp. TT121SHDZB]|uniref:hypothetical protein n=1 Tax=Bartonella sp. TT121SHDZB TaxID=3243580 RepID=UPI0035D0BF07